MITAICQECDKQFDYDLKPGYPRKYCPECSAIKKQAFEDNQPIPVVKPGLPDQTTGNQTFKKAPVVNGQLPMYVSYAKDIFIAIHDKEVDLRQEMKIATALVKQAMQELS